MGHVLDTSGEVDCVDMPLLSAEELRNPTEELLPQLVIGASLVLSLVWVTCVATFTPHPPPEDIGRALEGFETMGKKLFSFFDALKD